MKNIILHPEKAVKDLLNRSSRVSSTDIRYFCYDNHIWLQQHPKIFLQLQKKFILIADCFDILYFAKDVPQVNISLFQKAIIQKNSAWWCVRFAQTIKGADLTALSKVVLKKPITIPPDMYSKFIALWKFKSFI